MSPSPQQSERRRHPRIALSSPGRFMAEDGSEHTCTVRDISLVGLGIMSDRQVTPGEHIIIYLDDLGRFEGLVVRVFEGGFAIETSLTGPRRDRVAERLEAIARGEKDRNVTRRAFARHSPAEAGLEEGSLLTLADGSARPCRIIDMSLGGAQVALEQRPPIGTGVSIGRMKGQVVRHTEEGIGIQFLDIPDDAAAMSRPFSRG